MKNQLLSKLNKKATNYTVSRTPIARYASEGYIFTSSKINVDPNYVQLVATMLFHEQIVQAVEVYCASLAKSFTIKKFSCSIDGVGVVTSNSDYEFSDFFTLNDREKNHAIIKITTFDIPDKHLRRISRHHNSFNDLTHYLKTVPINALSQLYPDFTEEEESSLVIRLQLINCDQHEYRIKQLVLGNHESNYFEFDAAIGKDHINKLMDRLDRDESRKVEAIFRMNSTTAMIYRTTDSAKFNPIIFSWSQQDFTTRDNKTIFEINNDFISLIARLENHDLAELQKLKTAEEAIQYLTSCAV